MIGDENPIHGFLAADHDRLDALLAQAALDSEQIDEETYAAFREGLLRHIGIEEKILMPAAAAQLERPLPGAARLRSDHGRIALLLTRRPTHALIGELRALLEPHNAFEEAPDGVYARAERLVAARSDEIMARMRAAPRVPVAAYRDA